MDLLSLIIGLVIGWLIGSLLATYYYYKRFYNLSQDLIEFMTNLGNDQMRRAMEEKMQKRKFQGAS